MHRITRRLLGGTAVITLLFPASVVAQTQANAAQSRHSRWLQEASSFDQLRMLVKPGDTVLVDDVSGGNVHGKIVELSSSLLRIDVSGIARDFTQSEVREIRQLRPDPLSNGAGIGALTGLGVATTLTLLSCAGEDCKLGGVFFALGACTAIGSGVGVGIDALIVRERTIFRHNLPASARMRIVPLLGRHTKGVSVVLSF